MIVGNEIVLKMIRSSIKRNEFSHSYIIEGEKGLGKSIMAEYFAKGIQCEGENKPCNKCTPCKTINSKNNVDIFYINPSKGKKTIGVENIREGVIQNLAIKPYRNKYKIYIIDRCETMTIMAQNMLLKSIEEPPRHSIFFLMTRNSSSFLETIKSRCVTLKCKEVSDEQVENYLIEEKGIEKNVSKEMSMIGRGNIGVSIDSYEDNELKEEVEDIIDTFISLKNKNLVEVFGLGKKFKEYDKDIQMLLDVIIVFYRDVIVYKRTADIRHVIQKGRIEKIKEESEKWTIKNLVKKVENIMVCKRRLKNNCNFGLTIEMMLLKMKEK